MARDVSKILLAHFETRLPLMIWGSSGYGKSSLVMDFAKNQGFDVVTLHAQYLDPLALFIPSTQEMKELGYVKVYPSQVLHRIFTAKSKTILFLDELTRAREETFNILTELLLDRSVFGYRVPPQVLIIAASNFSEEDSGVRDLPDAVMQRLTHLIHAPDMRSSAQNLTSQILREILLKDPRSIRPPGRYPIHDSLKSCPRQLDACGILAEAGLRGDDLVDVCRGRVGIEAGTDIAIRLEMQLCGTASLLPQTIAPEEYLRIAKAEVEGGVLEVVRFLTQQMASQANHAHIAGYLLEFASPETCRSLQVHGFTYQYSGIPRRVNGQPFKSKSKTDFEPVTIEMPGKPWQWYAIKLAKLTPR